MDGGRLPVGSRLDSLPATHAAAAVSVNDAELERLRARLPRLRVVGEDLPLQVPVRYSPPEDLGRDRVMSVVGALHRCPEAQSVLVVDLGTCMTFTLGLRGELADAGIRVSLLRSGPSLTSFARDWQSEAAGHAFEAWQAGGHLTAGGIVNPELRFPIQFVAERFSLDVGHDVEEEGMCLP